MNLNRYLYHTLEEKEQHSTYLGKPDVEIWRMFKEGDDGAFIFIYRNHIRSLYNIGLQFTPDEELVKDCIQDLFVQLRERRHNLGNTDNIRLYLYKSFRRRIIAHINKRKKYLLRDALKNSFAIDFAIDEKLINPQFSEDQLKSLKTAIEKLSSKEREIIYFYFYENLSYREIAEILNYDHISSARRSVYKILKKLKNFMAVLFIIHTYSH